MFSEGILIVANQSGPFWAMCIGTGLVTTVNTMGKVAGLLNLRVKAGLSNSVEKIGESGGVPDLKEYADMPEDDKLQSSKRPSSH
jgi:hypothetical protein